MNLDQQELLDLVVVASVFLLVLAVWVMAMLVAKMRRSKRSEKIEQRLGLADARQEGSRTLSLWHKDKEVQTTVAGQNRWRGPIARFDTLLAEAGWTLPSSAAALALAGTAVLGEVGLFLLTGNVLPGLCLAAGLLLGFWLYLNHCITRRRSIYEVQLVDALDLAARSLRAGHPLLGSFQLISEEIPPPVSHTFTEICGQHALGMNLEEALDRVAQQSTSEDLKLFSTSVIIQRRSGGNLAEMMERLAEVIRERMRLNRRVRVLTAQTQFSKRVLLTLPFFVFFLLNILGPEYMHPLYTTTAGHILLTVGAVKLICGAWMMNKMVRSVG